MSREVHPFEWIFPGYWVLPLVVYAYGVYQIWFVLKFAGLISWVNSISPGDMTIVYLVKAFLTLFFPVPAFIGMAKLMALPFIAIFGS
jgi:hypothetical protein